MPLARVLLPPPPEPRAGLGGPPRRGAGRAGGAARRPPPAAAARRGGLGARVAELAPMLGAAPAGGRVERARREKTLVPVSAAGVTAVLDRLRAAQPGAAAVHQHPAGDASRRSCSGCSACCCCSATSPCSGIIFPARAEKRAELAGALEIQMANESRAVSRLRSPASPAATSSKQNRQVALPQPPHRRAYLLLEPALRPPRRGAAGRRAPQPARPVRPGRQGVARLHRDAGASATTG